MEVAIQVIQIVLSVAIIAIVMLQAKGSGLGSAFGGGGGVYRTKRGVEKLLYQITIALSVIFCLLSLFSVLLIG